MNVNAQISQDKILKEFTKKSEEIVEKMLHVLIRAQRKVDDNAYRNTIQKFQQTKI